MTESVAIREDELRFFSPVRNITRGEFVRKVRLQMKQTGEDFVRELLDNPLDRELWSIYADWLLEQNDPVGRLMLCDKKVIRARASQGLSAPPKRDRREEHSELLEAHLPQWLGDDSGMISVDGRNAKVRWNAQRMEMSFSMGHIRTLKLELTSKDTAPIAQCLTSLKRCRVMQLLREISIYFGDQVRTVRANMEALLSNPPLSIAVLRIHGHDRSICYTPESLGQYAPRLETLVLKNAPMGLSHASAWPNLRCLALLGRSIRSEVIGALCAQERPIEQLNIGHISAEAIPRLEPIFKASNLPKVERLALHSHSASPALLTALHGSELASQLRGLRLLGRLSEPKNVLSSRSQLASIKRFHLPDTWQVRQAKPRLTEAFGERLRIGKWPRGDTENDWFV